MANIPKLRLMLARMEKSASWMDMVQRAIAKLPGRAPQASQLGKQIYRGFREGDNAVGFQGLAHASIHPSIAFRYGLAGTANSQPWMLPGGGYLQYLLKKFDVDPQVQKHFPNFGLLGSLGHKANNNAPSSLFGDAAWRNTGRTVSEVQQFLKQNPIYRVPSAQITTSTRPSWVHSLDPSELANHIKDPSKFDFSTIPSTRGWFNSQVSPQKLFKNLTYETGVNSNNFSGLVSFNPATNKLADIPHNIAKDLIKGAGVTKEELPWRDRVEVYTQNPKGKIYGGIWDNDKSFALPGGGIDEGEDPLLAALRELKEETGITAKNPRLLPIDPVDSPWSDAHRAKIKRNFAGSRTHFVLADALGRRGNKNLDVWNASNRGYYTPAKAIDIMNSNTNYMAPTAAAARLKALQHIQSLAMAAAKEKSAAPMNLYSYIPNGSIEHVKKHGLLSGNELAKPENRHLLDIARPDGDADRWLKERDARLAKSPWTNSYNGPSAFFGDIDAEKIHDKHPIKKFNTTRAVIKLRELLRDYPATKMEGSELIPFSDTTYDALDEKGRNEFVNKRHHTLSLDEIKALLTRGQNPKDMWKDFKDTEGKYYASDVPHAQVVTPMGKIPSKYIEFK